MPTTGVPFGDRPIFRQPLNAVRDAVGRGTVAHLSQIARHWQQHGTMLKRDFGVLLLSVCAFFLSLQHEGAYQFRKAWWVARRCCRVLPPPTAPPAAAARRHCPAGSTSPELPPRWFWLVQVPPVFRA